MKTVTSTGILLACAALASAAPAFADDVTVVSFGGTYQDAQRAVMFKPFEAASGIKVTEESWDGGIGVLNAKAKSGTPDWDVVQVEAEDLALGCADGLFEKLDWAALGGKDKFLPMAVSDCGVGTAVWSMAIAYDGATTTKAPQSWADFWNVADFPGKRALRKGPKYTLEFALLADGVPADQLYKVLATPEGVDRAFAKLDALRPNLIWWEAGAQPLQFLASGEVAMTSTFNGRITGINKSEGKDFRLVWPGSMYSVDSWTILRGSAHPEAAQKFLSFATAPEQQSKMPEFVAYGMTNLAGIEKIPADLLKDLPTAPDNIRDAIGLDTDFWVDNNEALTERFNAWLAE
ncbi:ABC transporter substrate-binding protein [Paracoccus aminophilus]|uniref:Spermidine/putrescine transport system, substrate-binding protein n=1 Tax=Paracoccus aminophilus JCM 7686 TaxID=1367847 RepID=S5XNF8_PARAH|nr:ABC transporter substrate-binding protein [Paracoccus aminophilus]AGT08859.1 spermidine/putrescine transport system, substrate-binding protein [Paracoccus aminophilus JCM 7686]